LAGADLHRHQVSTQRRDIAPSILSHALGNAWTTAKAALRSFGPGGAPNRLLQVPPHPLIYPQAKLLVVFSPKSACSSVVIWFFHQLGIAEEAREHSSWPHKYRLEKYMKSKLYRDALSLDLREFKIVRVVRDPFERAVSSFRQTQTHGYLDADFSRLLGISGVAERGVSFCEFLDLLEHLDLATCNRHIGYQRHPIEDHLPVSHLINVSAEDLFSGLNQVEADYGLPKTDFDRLDWLLQLDRHRGVRKPRIIDTPDAYELPLTRQQARSGPWPRYSALLTPLARQRISRLFAVDFAAYGDRSLQVDWDRIRPSEFKQVGQTRAKHGAQRALNAEQRAIRLERRASRAEKRRQRLLEPQTAPDAPASTRTPD